MASGIEVRIQGSETGYQDLHDVFGVRLLRGAYESLLTPAPMKSYVTNESRLEHGKRYIPVNAKMQERDVSLNVILEGADYDDYLGKYESFLNLLSSGLTLLKVPRLKRIFKLVYTRTSKFQFYGYNRATFTLEFVEPDPSARQTLS